MTERLTDEALEALLGYDLHDSRGELCRTSDYEDQSWGMSIAACSITDTDAVVKALARELLAFRRATPADDLRAAVRTTLEGELSYGAYDCTRVWEAWSVGTMTQDDFVPVSERLDEITDAVVAALSQNGGAA